MMSMYLKLVSGAALLATVVSALPSPAEARCRPPYPAHGGHHHGQWSDRWENRRDARRAGIVAGVVVGSVAGAAARSNAGRRYQECIYGNTYDYDCERMRYYDEQRARQTAWRSGIAAGVVTREIVRN
ncbi:MAG: hypothetical protein ACKVOP_03705 [Sphingomonadaceae bacterium]